jgi:D-alanine-D-alanine ligase
MKKKIAIVAGGDSGEFDISIKSAAIVEQHLSPDLYEPYLIIMRYGEWSHTYNGTKYHIDKDDFSLRIDNAKICFDAVFFAIHGTPGEDGKLQGYFDMLEIPYTACNHTTSAITFNKYFCNCMISSMGVKVAPSVILYKGKKIDDKDILEVTSLPAFVKPNNGGSSVGMSKVKDTESLPAAVTRAFEEDDQVLVEAFIPGREITCGVLEIDREIKSLPLTEIITGNEFFDFEAKYTTGKAEEITPAQIPAEIEKECRSTSEMLYMKLNCKGIVRFDYIFNDTGLYFLEVNTIPGLSPRSIVPQQARIAGISLQELFSLIIEQALA